MQVSARLSQLDGEAERLAAKIEAAAAELKVAPAGKEAVYQGIYDNLVAKEKQVMSERALTLQLGAGAKRDAEDSVEASWELKRLRLSAWSPDAACATVERFKKAIFDLPQLPHNVEALQHLFKSRPPFIPVTEAFMAEASSLPQRHFLVLGVGGLAEHFSATLRSLANTISGTSENITTVEVTAQLFRMLYRRLDQYLGDDALGAEVIMNESVSKASSKLHSAVEPNKRPDHAVISRRKQTLGVVEDKQAGDMLSAEDDLREKLAGGLFAPAYQGIAAILVAASAGTDIKFGMCAIDGTVTMMKNAFSVASLGGAIAAVVASTTFYAILLKLQDLSPQEITMAAFGVPIHRHENTTIVLNALKYGVTKTIKEFTTYCTKFGTSLETLQAAYSISCPFLPELKVLPGDNPYVTTTRKGGQVYHLQMSTYGWALKVSMLSEEEVARCVYAWLCVASLLHDKLIAAADLRWENLMKQQPRAPPGMAVSAAYRQLPWIPLVIDLELARPVDCEPIQMLQDWGPDVLVDGKYGCSSDVYQIGIMLQLWCDASGCDLSQRGMECKEALLSHNHTAAEIASTSPWLHDAREIFKGVAAAPKAAS